MEDSWRREHDCATTSTGGESRGAAVGHRRKHDSATISTGGEGLEAMTASTSNEDDANDDGDGDERR